MDADDEEEYSGGSGECRDDKEARIPGVAQQECTICKKTKHVQWLSDVCEYVSGGCLFNCVTGCLSKCVTRLN